MDLRSYVRTGVRCRNHARQLAFLRHPPRRPGVPDLGGVPSSNDEKAPTHLQWRKLGLRTPTVVLVTARPHELNYVPTCERQGAASALRLPTRRRKAHAREEARRACWRSLAQEPRWEMMTNGSSGDFDASHEARGRGVWPAGDR